MVEDWAVVLLVISSSGFVLLTALLISWKEHKYRLKEKLLTEKTMFFKDFLKCLLDEENMLLYFEDYLKKIGKLQKLDKNNNEIKWLLNDFEKYKKEWVDSLKIRDKEITEIRPMIYLYIDNEKFLKIVRSLQNEIEYARRLLLAACQMNYPWPIEFYGDLYTNLLPSLKNIDNKIHKISGFLKDEISI